MEKSNLLKISAVILFVLALAIVYIGIKADMLAPLLTGAGFLVIAIVFINLSKK
jgi:hypothetical protein